MLFGSKVKSCVYVPDKNIVSGSVVPPPPLLLLVTLLSLIMMSEVSSEAHEKSRVIIANPRIKLFFMFFEFLILIVVLKFIF